MTLTVNGVDMLPYIKDKGIRRSRQDVLGQELQTLNGTRYRNRIAEKLVLDVACRPLTSKELNVVLNAIKPEYVEVYYEDPERGDVLLSMFSDNAPATFCVRHSDGTEWWDGVSFQLSEQ